MLSKKFILRNWFVISLVCLLFLSAILRFYNYQNRWGLAYDQAYSALVARYALEAGKIPLVGPFSSAGPMQTGGEWYYFVMLGQIFNQNEAIMPWIFLTIVYISFVLLMVLLGKELVSKKFGIILGILTLVSTAQIAQSVSLTNQSPLAMISLFAILSMVKYIKTKKLRYLFFLGLSVSLAISFHLQGVALIALVVSTIIFGRVNPMGILVILAGLSIPMIPLLLFDIKNDFVNLRSMIQYYLYDQYKISLDVLGRRWLTYGGMFWPNAWSHIIGGNKIVGYVILISLTGITFISFLKKQIYKEWQIILTSFIAMVTLLRYIRTPLYDSYLVFLHPFVFLLTGWVILFLYKKRKFIGLAFIVIIVITSLYKDASELNYNKTNASALEASSQVLILTHKFPNQKFSIYSYKYQWAANNLILSLFLDSEKLIDSNGRRVGIVVGTESATLAYPSIQGDRLGVRLLDLNSSSSSELEKSQWANVNPKQIYYVTQEWYTKSK